MKVGDKVKYKNAHMSEVTNGIVVSVMEIKDCVRKECIGRNVCYVQECDGYIPTMVFYRGFNN
jgi:hypothetical protein